MANRERGEFELSVNGKPYTLVLDINAMVALEDLFSTPQREVTFQDVLDRILKGSIKHIRAVVWAALRRHHADVAIDAVGDFIADAGGVAGLMELLLKAAQATTPDDADIQALGGADRPQTARTDARAKGGTGARSVFRRVRSV